MYIIVIFNIIIFIHPYEKDMQIFSAVQSLSKNIWCASKVEQIVPNKDSNSVLYNNCGYITC